MAYDLDSFVRLRELKSLVTRTASEINKAATTANNAFQSAEVSGNTLKFYKTPDKSGTPAFTADFPKEIFLDATKTKFESKFKFEAAKYPGAVNPSLDDKPVFVLAVKGTTDREKGTEEDTVTYSFLDMAALVDTYTAKAGNSAKVLNISGYEIEFKLDTDPNNALRITDNGLMLDMTGKANRATNATAGHFATLDADGNPTDSGIRVATAAEVTEMLNEVFGEPESGGGDD